MTNDTIPTSTTIEVGTILPNGAEVIEAKLTEAHLTTDGQVAENGVVLCRSQGEYVTWAYHLEGDGPVGTFWGHYSTTITDACLDYAGRS